MLDDMNWVVNLHLNNTYQLVSC